MAPAAWVISLTASTAKGSNTTSASCSANFRRSGMGSVMAMKDTPAARATMAVTMPMGPQPMMAMRSPMVNRARFTACTPTASGSRVAAAA